MEKKYNIKSGDYVSILAPMVQKLKLSGNNLLVFALIHGYSKDDEHTFHGSINYISCWLNISRNAVIDTLKVLVDSNYITKKEFFKNSVKFCEYKSNYEHLIKKLDSGCEIALPVAKTRKGSAKTGLGSAEMQPNIDIYIDKDIDRKEKKDTIVSKEKKFSFLNSLLELGIEENIAKDFMLVRKNKKATNSETAFDAIKREIEKTNATPNECIKLCVERDWKGFKAEWYERIQPSMFDDNYINNRVADMQKSIDEKLSNRQTVKHNGKEYR